jgi:hypothetical protein
MRRLAAYQAAGCRFYRARAAMRLSLRNNHRVWATLQVLGDDFLAKTSRAEKVRGHLVLKLLSTIRDSQSEIGN